MTDNQQNNVDIGQALHIINNLFDGLDKDVKKITIEQSKLIYRVNEITDVMNRLEVIINGQYAGDESLKSMISELRIKVKALEESNKQLNTLTKQQKIVDREGFWKVLIAVVTALFSILVGIFIGSK